MALEIDPGKTLLVALQTMFKHQAMAGNFPMRLRWNFHRWMLGQSMGFYQDEFAGRIATKVMQTALAVRDTILIVADILVFVVIAALVGGIGRQPRCERRRDDGRLGHAFLGGQLVQADGGQRGGDGRDRRLVTGQQVPVVVRVDDHGATRPADGRGHARFGPRRPVAGRDHRRDRR